MSVFERDVAPELRAISKAAWQKPDTVLIDAAAEGEWHVAKVRLFVVAMLLIVPGYRVLRYPGVQEYVTGFIVTVCSAILAAAIYLYLRRGTYQPWLGFLTSWLDVTLVSVAMLSFALVGPPYAAANSRITFQIYFLTIFSSSLRYDRRICISTGLVAVVQYLAIVFVDVHKWGINDPRYSPFAYGTFTWADQVTRAILMCAAILLSWEIVRRAQRLRQISNIDPLTELPNRTYFDRRALAELSRARRHGHSFSVAIIDVDRFKQFNDTYGHATGDRVLRTIAQVLHENVRVSDLVARYGGEEFVVLLPETGLDQALYKIDGLRRAVAATDFQTGTERVALTVSAGVACYPVDALEYADLLRDADARLLAAKQKGRNRVIGASAGVSSQAST